MTAPSITVTPEKFQLVLGVNDDIAISITNVGFSAVIFRLLTTAPERYVVKHTKGVIKGNSTTKVTITLNAKHVVAAANQQLEGGSGGRIIKDDFRLEYAEQGVDDVIEPRASNVPQLIKDKKAANPALVQKKMLRCHVLLDAADAASSISNPSPGGANAAGADRMGGGQTGRDTMRMSATEMQENTWREKNKRRTGAAGGGANSTAAGQGNGRGGVVATEGAATQRMQLLLILVAIIAAGAMWLFVE